MPSEAPPRDREERERRRVERLVPEIVKRLVEAGVEKLGDSPETVRQWANELRLPKELLSAVLSHVDDAKSEIFQAVAREVREFLDRANLADELTRVLTGVTLEVKTQVRFVPNDSKGGRLRPSANASVSLGREDAEEAGQRSPSTDNNDPEEYVP